MIDKEQLKELGWSDELINEVTRVSDRIEESVDSQAALENTKFSLTSESGSSISFTASDISTNSNLKLK